MSGPWEKYSAPADTSAPWAKYGAPPSVEAAPSVVDEMSTGQRLAAAVGGRTVDAGLGLKQRLDDAALWLERKVGGQGLSRALGMPTAAQAKAATDAEVAEKRRVDAPLLATSAGKVGSVVGSFLPAVAASMVPGGQTLLGSIVTGGALGAVEPTLGDESVLRNTAVGATGGAVGYGGAKVIGAGAQAVKGATAKRATVNAGRDAAAVSAREAGYVLPPSTSNPGTVNSLLEGLAGKISTAQKASQANQAVTNAKAARSLGLPPDQPITQAALEGVRKQAGAAYDAVRTAGTIRTDAQFASDLMQITHAAKNASKSFPGLAKSEIDDVVTSLRQPTFDSSSAVDAIRILRDKADTAFAGGDKSLGKAYRDAAGALESQLDRHLSKAAAAANKAIGKAGGTPGLGDPIGEFRQARELIAKTYSVQKALNAETGNVSAQKLGAQLAKGKPLSGELRDAGSLGLAFPKAAQEIRDSVPGLSPLDWTAAGGIGAASGSPWSLAAVAARPAARSLILSRPYQSLMGAPSYGTTLADMVGSRPALQGARLGTLALGLNAPLLAQEQP